MFTIYRRAEPWGEVKERYYTQLENALKELRRDAEYMGVEFDLIAKGRLDRMTVQDAMKGVTIHAYTSDSKHVVFEIVIKFFSDIDYQVV